MTAFTTILPWASVLHIWDVFLLLGRVFLHKVALGIIEIHQSEKLSLSWLSCTPPTSLPPPPQLPRRENSWIRGYAGDPRICPEYSQGYSLPRTAVQGNQEPESQEQGPRENHPGSVHDLLEVITPLTFPAALLLPQKISMFPCLFQLFFPFLFSPTPPSFMDQAKISKT